MVGERGAAADGVGADSGAVSDTDGLPSGLDGPADLEGLDPLLVEGMRVLRYPHTTEKDENGEQTEWHCDVVVADGVPAPGFSTYATSGVRQFPTNLTSEDGKELCTEFVLAARTTAREAADVADACALAASNGTFHIAPGAVIPDAVKFVAPNLRCEHILLVPPFLWPELEVVRDLSDDVVLTRLQAVPITRGELQFAAEKGADALMERLESRGADVSNFDRPSVV